MRSFVAGAVLGAVVTYFYVTGLAPVYERVAGMWARVSSPPAPVSAPR